MYEWEFKIIESTQNNEKKRKYCKSKRNEIDINKLYRYIKDGTWQNIRN